MADTRDLKERWKAVLKLCDAELATARRGRNTHQWLKTRQLIEALLVELDPLIEMEMAAAQAWQKARGVIPDTEKPKFSLVKNT